MIDQNEKAVLSLIGRALFGLSVTVDPNIPLSAVFEEACHQSVFPLIYSSLTKEEKKTIPPNEQQKWQTHFYQHTAKALQLIHAQNQVLSLLTEHQIPVAVLKGSTCAANYPDPHLRAMGDIDILVPPCEQERVVALLQEKGYSDVLDEEHHCHFTIYKDNIAVEVHKEPNGVFITENAELKSKFSAFFEHALDKLELLGGYPTLTDPYQAVVLLLHKLEHFISGGLGLRQLCDWAVFVKNRITPALWQELAPLLESLGLLTFTLVISKACIDNLGLPAECAPWAQNCDPALSDQVIEHIVKSGNFGIKDRAYGEHFFVNTHSKNRITSMFKVLGSSCRKHWPICKTYPILMPIALFVVYFRYLGLRMQGKRPKFEMIKLYRRSGTKQQLYKDLMPFINDSNNKEG